LEQYDEALAYPGRFAAITQSVELLMLKAESASVLPSPPFSPH
jgi:hypothetical protein